MANVLKLPPITNSTKLLSFDLESNGLHGEIFAVGALVINADGTITNQFTARAKIQEPIDEWVHKHVLPAIASMPTDHTTSKQLRDAFWPWFVSAQTASDYVVVQNGYPVEYRFLQTCQQDDLEQRFWQHPFPILDLTSLAVQAGKDAKELRQQVIQQHKSSLVGGSHHPLFDAHVTALMAFELLLPDSD